METILVQTTSGRKIYFSRFAVHCEGKRGQEMKADTWRQELKQEYPISIYPWGWGRRMLLTDLLSIAHSVCFLIQSNIVAKPSFQFPIPPQISQGKILSLASISISYTYSKPSDP